MAVLKPEAERLSRKDAMVFSETHVQVGDWMEVSARVIDEQANRTLLDVNVVFPAVEALGMSYPECTIFAGEGAASKRCAAELRSRIEDNLGLTVDLIDVGKYVEDAEDSNGPLNPDIPGERATTSLRVRDR